MSISLPFARAGWNTGPQVTRASRSGFWLRADQALRNSQHASAVDASPAVSESPRSSERPACANDIPSPIAIEQPDSTQASSTSSTSSMKKPNASRRISFGKAARYQSPPVADYVEEGSISRPIFSFFSAHVPATTSKPVASTSFTDPLYEFQVYGRLPDNVQHARQLISSIAAQKQPRRYAKAILKAFKHDYEVSKDVKSALLQGILSPSSADPQRINLLYHTRRVNGALQADANATRSTWIQYWHGAGEQSHLPSTGAAAVLQAILGRPPKATEDSAFTAKPLRHLLFLAGLQEHQSLAIAVLVRALERSAALATVDPSDETAQAHSSTTNEIVLLLQDLLRSGILPPALAKNYKLSEVLKQALQLEQHEFEHLLRQTLVRICLQIYIDQRNLSHMHAPVALLTELPASSKIACPVNTTDLLRSVLETCIESARGDTGAFLQSFRLTRRILEKAFTGHLSTEVTNDEAGFPFVEQLRPLFALALKTGQDATPLASTDSHVRCLDLLQQLKQFGLPLAESIGHIRTQDLASLLSYIANEDRSPIYNLSHISDDPSTVEPFESLVLALEMHMLERLVVAPEPFLSNDSANNLVMASSSILHSRKKFSAEVQKAHLKAMFDIYQVLSTSNAVTGGFALDSRHLQRVVYRAKQARAFGVDCPSPSTIVDHFTRRREGSTNVSHADYSALASALLIEGEPYAAWRILQEMVQRKHVPSAVDLITCLRILSKRHPEAALDLLEGATARGLQATRLQPGLRVLRHHLERRRDIGLAPALSLDPTGVDDTTTSSVDG